MPDLQSLAGSRRTIGDLVMSRNTSRLKDLVFVLVEGESDRAFFSNFLQWCKIYPQAGWEKLLEVIREAEAINFKGLVGILDADFRRILPEKYAGLPSNVLLTDLHDVEMQLIQSEALEKVLVEYDRDHESDMHKRAAFERKRSAPIRNVLLQEARKIGAVRLVNHREEWRLSFKQKEAKEPLDFDFVHLEKVETDLNKLLQVLEQKNQRHGFFSKNELAKPLIQAELEKDHDVWQLCNGHDVVRILAIALEKAISNEGKGNLNKRVEMLESQLRIAYQKEHFAQTQLYRDLKAWPVPEGFKLEILP